ncbi:hypothetical protein [Acidovorax sp. 93]|uniref:hypothetical protein n=1 Tax=Acidovorax sp. 93 TaxID=2135632 RepID=UPI0011C3833D|nr:hypothetical protein [Acidovorax sp. 93]
MVITLNPLLKFSAGQWNTLVNIGLALCGLAGQDCIGTNNPIVPSGNIGPSSRYRLGVADPSWTHERLYSLQNCLFLK